MTLEDKAEFLSNEIFNEKSGYMQTNGTFTLYVYKVQEFKELIKAGKNVLEQKEGAKIQD